MANLGVAVVAGTLWQAAVIEMRFGLRDDDEKTLEEVGQVFDVTRERIRQIQNQQ